MNETNKKGGRSVRQPVQGKVPDQHHSKSLDVSYELLAQHPELQHRVLHDVLCLVQQMLLKQNRKY